jgi:hypothetical protein
MQELRIFRWCDVCHAESAQAEATERYLVEIGAPDGRPASPRLVETCEQHGKLFREARDLARQVGAIPKERTTAEPLAEPAPVLSGPKSTITCPLCELEMARSSVIGHLERVHGAKPYVHPRKCPDCGERWADSRTKGNSMAVHRRRVHGWDYVAEMASRAKR